MGSVQGIHVQTLGSRTTLQCEYWKIPSNDFYWESTKQGSMFRLYLAELHYNENIGRSQAMNSTEEVQYRVSMFRLYTTMRILEDPKQ